MFFDPQDLFDPTKTSVNFTNRMILASQRTNTYDRYTFERLLSCIGMGSSPSPEYGVWVYNDSGNLTLRTKVNLNYDNTAQITNVNAPYVAMPTNLAPWTPVRFFTNAAELLLRSQGHSYYFYTNNLVYVITNYFGVTNIPIYNASNPGIHYDAAVHRMLQLAANIYDATEAGYTNSVGAGLPVVRHPTIFRPLFGIAGTDPTKRTGASGTNVAVYITGYVQVTNAEAAYAQMFYPFQDLTKVTMANFNTNWNVAGIPWIVAADKGLPAFNHYTSGSQLLLERKLVFQRPLDASGKPITNMPPNYTNQFYCVGVTNSIGMDAWNPYRSAFTGSVGPLYHYCSNYITVQLTNEYNCGVTFALTNALINHENLWPAGGGGANSKNGVLTLFNTNLITLPESYYSRSANQFIVLTNGDIASNAFSASDINQKAWPIYNWTLNVTNHVVYALFDGIPTSASSAMLDFVNLGPFGTSVSLTNVIWTNTSGSSGGVLGVNGAAGQVTPGAFWSPAGASGAPNSPMSQGVINQISAGIQANGVFAANLRGQGTSQATFECPVMPTFIIQQPTNWVVNDPLVHYTIGDLVWPGDSSLLQAYNVTSTSVSGSSGASIAPFFTNTIGMVSARYQPWGATPGMYNNMLYKDPLISTSDLWNFPTNKFPGIGWLGRVHRGTPWQTVYLKADPTQGLGTSYANWANWANPSWIVSTNAPENYPTKDWELVDLFTTAINDDSARGLLGVNQTNDAAWAAVFAGVMALTTTNDNVIGVPLSPINDVYNIVDANSIYGGINAYRTNQPNGLFHKIGDILGTPALTIASPYVTNVSASLLTDDMIERIPQQTLSFLRVGEPQFVIFAWGQALRPKGPPYLGSGPNVNTYTNYEITGEVLTRTVCHLVHTNGVKMVIDSYNVESGNN